MSKLIRVTHCCTWASSVSWCLGVWVSGCLGVWVSGCLGVWVSGCLGVWVSGCLGVWVSGRLGVWVSGCLGVWVSGCLGVWVSGCLGVWVSGCLGVWVWVSVEEEGGQGAGAPAIPAGIGGEGARRPVAQGASSLCAWHPLAGGRGRADRAGVGVRVQMLGVCDIAGWDCARGLGHAGAGAARRLDWLIRTRLDWTDDGRGSPRIRLHTVRIGAVCGPRRGSPIVGLEDCRGEASAGSWTIW